MKCKLFAKIMSFVFFECSTFMSIFHVNRQCLKTSLPTFMGCWRYVNKRNTFMSVEKWFFLWCRLKIAFLFWVRLHFGIKIRPQILFRRQRNSQFSKYQLNSNHSRKSTNFIRLQNHIFSLNLSVERILNLPSISRWFWKLL